MSQPNQQQVFALSIRSWDADHLARCLVSQDVNGEAKEAIRAELSRRGVDLDKATARAAVQTATASADAPLSWRQKLFVWGPATLIFCVIAVGVYLVSV